jgi:hypothetical protein
MKLELQIRSKLQHHWAESIERTSVVYGYLLKEGEGDSSVIQYFRYLSEIFHDIENKMKSSPLSLINIENLKSRASETITSSDRGNVLQSFVNEGIINTLAEVESRNPTPFSNWIFVFDWKNGSFVTWDIIDRDPSKAMEKYTQYEAEFPEQNKFEVVLVGSSNIQTIRRTHSHYFGIDSIENILDGLNEQVLGFRKHRDLDAGARTVLLRLRNKHYWGKKTVALSTLKTHYCRDVFDLDGCLSTLMALDLIYMPGRDGPISLNIKKTDEIQSYLYQ